MAKPEFSESFQTFVNKHITSVEQIEVLLILLANREREWTIDEISAILRSSPNSIQSRLDALIKTGLAAGSPEQGYRYKASGRLHRMVEMLKDEYTARRFSVIELIFSRPDPLLTFADAFRFREDDDDAS